MSAWYDTYTNAPDIPMEYSVEYERYTSITGTNYEQKVTTEINKRSALTYTAAKSGADQLQDTYTNTRVRRQNPAGAFEIQVTAVTYHGWQKA